MAEISLCMIVKDEEEVLDQCLQSVAPYCDEIIIVDTGSTDKTKEIAKKYTDNIYDFKWVDDFSAARNFSFKQATKDFILWLDADDILLEEDQRKLAELKEKLNDNIDAVSMIYHAYFDEYGKPTLTYRRNRLVKRKNNFKWIGAVHEYLDVRGKILSSSIVITHRKNKKMRKQTDKSRNLKIYESRKKKGLSFSPRDLFYYANELKDHQKYEEAITVYEQFLESKKGWVENEIRACLYMADCYRQLSKPNKEMEALTRSLHYDIPRPECCCRLGDLYKHRFKYKQAIFWYELALSVQSDHDSSFNFLAYSTWYPHMQLCVCYWKIGAIEKAIFHNEQAKKYRPNDKTIVANETFLKQYLKNNT